MGNIYSIVRTGSLLEVHLKNSAPLPVKTAAILSSQILGGHKPYPVGDPGPIPLHYVPLNELLGLGLAGPKQLLVRVESPGGVQNFSIALLDKNGPVFMTKPMALWSNQSGAVFSLDAQAQMAASVFWNPSCSLVGVGETSNGIIAILIGL